MSALLGQTFFWGGVLLLSACEDLSLDDSTDAEIAADKDHDIIMIIIMMCGLQ